MKTPYDVLGVAPDADEKTIANAFRAAAKACHPDLNPEDRAAERQFKQITAARDALKNPEWRALYRYLQLRRLHDRRHWMITMASCTLSALVSAGLVSLLQKQSISEPSFEERLPLLAASLDPEVGGGHRQFELAGIASEARRQEGGAARTAIQEMHAGPRQERETHDKPLDLAAFRQVPARPGLTVEAALREIIREQGNARTAPKQQAGKNCDRPDHRAAQSPQPAGERCAASDGSGREQQGPKPHAMVAARARGRPPAKRKAGEARFDSGPPRCATEPAEQRVVERVLARRGRRSLNALRNEGWQQVSSLGGNRRRPLPPSSRLGQRRHAAGVIVDPALRDLEAVGLPAMRAVEIDGPAAGARDAAGIGVDPGLDLARGLRAQEYQLAHATLPMGPDAFYRVRGVWRIASARGLRRPVDICAGH